MHVDESKFRRYRLFRAVGPETETAPPPSFVPVLTVTADPVVRKINKKWITIVKPGDD